MTNIHALDLDALSILTGDLDRAASIAHDTSFVFGASLRKLETLDDTSLNAPLASIVASPGRTITTIGQVLAAVADVRKRFVHVTNDVHEAKRQADILLDGGDLNSLSMLTSILDELKSVERQFATASGVGEALEDLALMLPEDSAESIACLGATNAFLLALDNFDTLNDRLRDTFTIAEEAGI